VAKCCFAISDHFNKRKYSRFTSAVSLLVAQERKVYASFRLNSMRASDPSDINAIFRADIPPEMKIMIFILKTSAHSGRYIHLIML
jgi:hypothetical protein